MITLIAVSIPGKIEAGQEKNITLSPTVQHQGQRTSTCQETQMPLTPCRSAPVHRGKSPGAAGGRSSPAPGPQGFGNGRESCQAFLHVMTQTLDLDWKVQRDLVDRDFLKVHLEEITLFTTATE